jgi:hypothetical protein
VWSSASKSQGNSFSSDWLTIFTSKNELGYCRVHGFTGYPKVLEVYRHQAAGDKKIDCFDSAPEVKFKCDNRYQQGNWKIKYWLNLLSIMFVILRKFL